MLLVYKKLRMIEKGPSARTYTEIGVDSNDLAAFEKLFNLRGLVLNARVFWPLT